MAMVVDWVRVVVSCGVFALVAGCGGDGVVTEGKVLKGGVPYTLTADTERISVNLQSQDGKASGGADVSPDGSFRVRSSTGGGMPAGKYTVTYTHYGVPGAKPGSSPATVSVVEPWEVGAGKAFTLDIATAKK